MPLSVQPSRRSLHGLDWFVFFVANALTGFGPFVAVYLTSQRWTQLDIGLVLSVAGLVSLINRSKSLAIKHRANVARWFIWEWVACQQAIHFMRALKQSEDQCDQPRIFARRSQSGEPHLPV